MKELFSKYNNVLLRVLTEKTLIITLTTMEVNLIPFHKDEITALVIQYPSNLLKNSRFCNKGSYWYNL